MKKLFLLFGILTALAAGAINDLGMTAEVFRDGKNELPYRQAVLGESKPGKYALLLFLHGAGERGNDNLQQLINNFPDIMAYCRKHELKIIVLAPQCPKECRWVEVDWGRKSHTIPKKPSKPMAMLLKLLDQKCAEFAVDPCRIYVTGISMGGYGSWDILCRRPDLFAGALILCGGCDVKEAPRLTEIPILFYHGNSDTIVPVVRSRKMAKALERAGGKKFEYRELDGGHFIWIPVYRDAKNFDWLFSQQKQIKK